MGKRGVKKIQICPILQHLPPLKETSNPAVDAAAKARRTDNPDAMDDKEDLQASTATMEDDESDLRRIQCLGDFSSRETWF